MRAEQLAVGLRRYRRTQRWRPAAAPTTAQRQRREPTGPVALKRRDRSQRWRVAAAPTTATRHRCDRWPSLDEPGPPDGRRAPPSYAHETKSILHSVDSTGAPSLLPVLRSQQQGEILALLLGDPDQELSLSDIARQTGAPHPSVFREVERAEQAGLVVSRRVGNVRLVRADTSSPYYAGLAEVLTRAFGAPAVLAEVLSGIGGIRQAFVFGSWAARHAGQRGVRPVGDIDVLVLGDPDRDALYEAAEAAERRLGRPVQVTVRDAAWLESGSGAFHETVTTRPMLRLDLPSGNGTE